ncbi:unnamed protein product [Chrysodeixis includens]|uniref:Uncharacterized protein n=1 Tax=Chrysodeixis includens TaxID=689277 RepID=A0A9N8KXT7_CHRIL|nr:unnamed protein product [Chrysodeixis includens]
MPTISATTLSCSFSYKAFVEVYSSVMFSNALVLNLTPPFTASMIVYFLFPRRDCSSFMVTLKKNPFCGLLSNLIVLPASRLRSRAALFSSLSADDCISSSCSLKLWSWSSKEGFTRKSPLSTASISTVVSIICRNLPRSSLSSDIGSVIDE